MFISDPSPGGLAFATLASLPAINSASLAFIAHIAGGRSALQARWRTGNEEMQKWETRGEDSGDLDSGGPWGDMGMRMLMF